MAWLIPVSLMQKRLLCHSDVQAIGLVSSVILKASADEMHVIVRGPREPQGPTGAPYYRVNACHRVERVMFLRFMRRGVARYS